MEYNPKLTVLKEASVGRDKRGEMREGSVTVHPYSLFNPLQAGSFHYEVAPGEATNCLERETSWSYRTVLMAEFGVVDPFEISFLYLRPLPPLHSTFFFTFLGSSLFTDLLMKLKIISTALTVLFLTLKLQT